MKPAEKRDNNKNRNWYNARWLKYGTPWNFS
jgi:hypothetical protein